MAAPLNTRQWLTHDGLRNHDPYATYEEDMRRMLWEKERALAMQTHPPDFLKGATPPNTTPPPKVPPKVPPTKSKVLLLCPSN